MKRKFEEQRRRISSDYEEPQQASVDDVDDDFHHHHHHHHHRAVHHHHRKLDSPPSRQCHHVNVNVNVSPQKPLKQRLSRTVTTRMRPVSPDHQSHHHQQNQPHDPTRKVVRFANPLVKVKEISRSFHSSNRRMPQQPQQQQDDTSSLTSVPKSVLFYSKHDYMKFYVRERSRLAFQDLTKRICQEQARRIRNRQRVIPPYFVALNFLNAVLTINELGHQVQQHAMMAKNCNFQQQQQFALYRQQKRRRKHLFQTLQQQQQQAQQQPSTTSTTTRRTRTRRSNNTTTSSSSNTSNTATITIPNHMTPPNLRGALNYQVTPRPPRRNTVCAAVA